MSDKKTNKDVEHAIEKHGWRWWPTDGQSSVLWPPHNHRNHQACFSGLKYEDNLVPNWLPSVDENGKCVDCMGKVETFYNGYELIIGLSITSFGEEAIFYNVLSSTDKKTWISLDQQVALSEKQVEEMKARGDTFFPRPDITFQANDMDCYVQ